MIAWQFSLLDLYLFVAISPFGSTGVNLVWTLCWLLGFGSLRDLDREVSSLDQSLENYLGGDGRPVSFEVLNTEIHEEEAT